MPEEAQKPEGARVGACTTVESGTGVEEFIVEGGMEDVAACPTQAVNRTGINTDNNIRMGFIVFNRTSGVNAPIAGNGTGKHQVIPSIRLPTGDRHQAS